jgi:hypothetical protein
MTPHNKYGDSQLFGKVTTKIIRLAQKPILIVKATKTVSMQKEKTEKEGARQSESSLQLHS